MRGIMRFGAAVALCAALIGCGGLSGVRAGGQDDPLVGTGRALGGAGAAVMDGVQQGLKGAGAGAQALFSGSEDLEPVRPFPAATDRVDVEERDDGWIVLNCRDFEGKAARKQQEPVWCWAACAEMLHRWEGRMDYTQDAIAEAILATVGDVEGEERAQLVRAGGVREVIRALVLDLDLHGDKGRELGAHVADGVTRRTLDADVSLTNIMMAKLRERTADPDLIVEALQRGEPVVVGFKPTSNTIGHACVIYGATYRPRPGAVDAEGMAEVVGVLGTATGRGGLSEDQAAVGSAIDRQVSEYVFDEIRYIDPETGGTVTLHEYDPQRVGFLMSRAEAEAIVRDELDAFRIDSR